MSPLPCSLANRFPTKSVRWREFQMCANVDLATSCADFLATEYSRCEWSLFIKKVQVRFFIKMYTKVPLYITYIFWNKHIAK